MALSNRWAGVLVCAMSAFLAVGLLGSDDSRVQTLAVPGGPRHNGLTTLARFKGGWLLGGMVNGPGTHSGDSDRAQIVADGFLRERAALPD